MESSKNQVTDSKEEESDMVVSLFSHQKFVSRVIRRRQYTLPLIDDAVLAAYPALVLFVGAR
jgi:hypothetical protein